MNFLGAEMYEDYSIPCTEIARCSWKKSEKCAKIPLNPLISSRVDSIIVMREEEKVHGIEYYMYKLGGVGPAFFIAKVPQDSSSSCAYGS